MNDSVEVWKVIGNYSNYEVSNLGRVRSWSQYGPGHGRRDRPKYLAGGSGKYPSVMIRGIRYAVHRLVLEAFIGTRPEGMECRHLDGNPKNNRLCNLQWGTPTQNSIDKRIHGTMICGSDSNLAKLTERDVEDIRTLCREGIARTEIAGRYGVHHVQVQRIARGESWSHSSEEVLTKSRKGEGNNSAKLLEADVREIRRMKESETIASLARRFGVSESCVRFIVKNKTWTHIKEN